MANIVKRVGKNGISYKITVTKGRDLNGKQIRHYLTWVPDHQMTERQMQKAVEKVAFEFEQSINQGYQIDQKQTFAAYAEYVLDLKEQGGCKYRTLERYRELLIRINQAIGHIKIQDIRPQHLNSFYKNLGEDGIAKISDKAVAIVDIDSLLKDRGIRKTKAAEISNLSATTIKAICNKHVVAFSSASSFADALNEDINKIFSIISDNKQLSTKTILEHHRLIHTVLAQAEKELIIPYNPADKATPPKNEQKEVNYFQPDEVQIIINALDAEPIKWRTITHLLLISGCRRGEIMGLKWSRVDFNNNLIKIDNNLLYTPKRGIYEDTPKTSSSVRYIKLPEETMQLLKEYREWYLDLRKRNGDRWQDTDYCFVRDDGSVMIPDSITAWQRKFAKKHNLPHINPKAFRHTMASILINNGKDVISVSKRLGHAKVSTTTDIYSHIIREADAISSESLADVILRPDSKQEK